MSIEQEVNDKIAETDVQSYCKLGRYLIGMPVNERDAIVYALGHFSSQWTSDTLNRNGYPIGKTAVSDHIAGRCACERS